MNKRLLTLAGIVILCVIIACLFFGCSHMSMENMENKEDTPVTKEVEEASINCADYDKLHCNDSKTCKWGPDNVCVLSEDLLNQSSGSAGGSSLGLSLNL